MLNKQDVALVRELGKQVAEVAALPHRRRPGGSGAGSTTSGRCGRW